MNDGQDRETSIETLARELKGIMSRNAGRINSTTLAQRLVLLEQVGLVRKTVQSTMPPRTNYELTKSGRALQPIIAAIAAWGERYMPDHMAPCGEN